MIGEKDTPTPDHYQELPMYEQDPEPKKNDDGHRDCPHLRLHQENRNLIELCIHPDSQYPECIGEDHEWCPNRKS